MFFKLVVKMYDFYLLLFFSPYYILFPHCAVFMPINFLVQNYFAGTWQQGIIRLRTPHSVQYDVHSLACLAYWGRAHTRQDLAPVHLSSLGPVYLWQQP